MTLRTAGFVPGIAAFLLVGVLRASALDGAWQLTTTIVQLIDTSGTTVSIEPKSRPHWSEPMLLVFNSNRELTVHTSTVDERATYLLVPGGCGDIMLSVRGKTETFMLSLVPVSDTEFVFSRLEPLPKYGAVDTTLLENCVGTMTKVSSPATNEG